MTSSPDVSPLDVSPLDPSPQDMAMVETLLMSSLQSVFDRYRANLRAMSAITGKKPGEIFASTVEDLIDHRSRFSGWKPEGFRNASGSCRLMSTADSRWLAVNLARQRDVDLLGAVLGLTGNESWSTIEAAISTWGADKLEVAVSELGLPMSFVGEVQWLGSMDELPIHHRLVQKTQPRKSTMAKVNVRTGAERMNVSRPLRIVDLSSLWAGPLCSRLLVAAGFEVTTVESAFRRDPSREQHPQFYDDLHQGKEHVVVDFDCKSDRRRLDQLLESCDVVIEGSRRRALAHLGIDVEGLLTSAQPSIWVSITGYGYQGPRESRVGFGDDCAVAGGLVCWDRASGSLRPHFIGDAIADPVTGVIAATAVLDCLSPKNGAHSPAPFGHHLQISLAEAANWVSRGGMAAIGRRECFYEGRL